MDNFFEWTYFSAKTKLRPDMEIFHKKLE